jgi:hypothetical protein
LQYNAQHSKWRVYSGWVPEHSGKDSRAGV